MRANIISSAKRLLPGVDWVLFRDSSILTVGSMLARALGFVITMMLARHFEPTDFGLVQYAVSVAGIISIGVQPFGQHVLSRYIGMYKDNQTKLLEYLSNIWVILGAVFCLSFVLASVVLWYADKYNFGFFAVFIGVSTFYVYYGLARGFLASGRLVAIDVGNNILQVVLILLLFQLLDSKSTLLAMLIRGLTPIIPVILLQRFWPLPNAFESKFINLETMKSVLKFSIPIWISHASYMLYATIAVLFLEHFTDTTMVGIFSLATTLGIALSFFPSGLATLLMPKIAAAPDKRYRSLLTGALGLVLLCDFVLVALYYFLGPWLVGTVFGDSYLLFPRIFVLMAVVETFAGVHTILTTVYVGRGRATEEMRSRLISVLATFVGCWLLIPVYGVIGAVWAKMIGVVCGLMVYGYVYIRDRMSRRSNQGK